MTHVDPDQLRASAAQRLLELQRLRKLRESVAVLILFAALLVLLAVSCLWLVR